MKKVIIFLLSVLTLVGLHMSARYTINEIYIHEYNNENYNKTFLTVLRIINYPESYIVYYNKGNNLYQEKEYKKAVDEYKKALKTVPKKKVCQIRTNLALAKLELIEYENNKNLRNELIEIEEILLEDKCATKDNKGRDKSSQELYNKIEEYLKSVGASGGEGNEDPDDDNNKPSNPDQPNEEDLEEKLRKQQRSAANARNDIYDKDPYEYYSGKNW